MRPDEALRQQGEACAALGSPMYADLLARLADDWASGGPTAAVLAGHEDDPAASALALRLLGSVHRLVLERRAGPVGLSYPSVGGTWHADAGSEAVLDLLAEQPEIVRAWLDRPPQTNEVGRAAVLVGGLLHLDDALRLPVRLVELGASAGLNLLADRFAVGDADGLVQDPAPQGRRPGVRLEGAWSGRRLRPWPGLAFVERLGCDLRPVDPRTTEGRLLLTAYVWPDQRDRLERLRAALAVAAEAPPVEVHPIGAADLVGALELRPGATTVVWHSVVLQYLPPAERVRLGDRVAALGRSATPEAPLVHLALEPPERGAGTPVGLPVTMRTWSGRADDGVPQVLGRAAPHGLPVHWD